MPEGRRTGIPRREWTRQRLQKEVGCRCPFCDRTDVEDFEIHHIDGDRSNHDEPNLILICGACHNLFSKEPQMERVLALKRELMRELWFLGMGSTGHDYMAYSMRPVNGRLPQDQPNGSRARLTVIDRYTLMLDVMESGGAEWVGYMTITHRSFGEMSWKYRTCHEFGQKVFELENEQDGGGITDTVFIQPSHFSMDHGIELFVRKRHKTQ